MERTNFAATDPTSDCADPYRGDEVEQLIAVTEPEETDAEALARFVAGDRDGLAVLVDRYDATLARAAWRVLGNHEDAHDAVQAAWCSVLRKAAAFEGRSTVSSWLWRIVRNEALDQLRRRITRPQPASREATDTVDRLSSAATDRTETRIVIDELLSSLSVEQRDVVVLVDLCGLSVEEAADALSIAPGTVKSRRARARAAMAARLSRANADGDLGVARFPVGRNRADAGCV